MIVSLGQASNYSVKRVFQHLFAYGNEQDSEQLRRNLAKRYDVEANNVALYHSGRSALCAAIKSVARGEHLPVILPGLTCIAVVRAIKAAGCEPVFIDIEKNNLEYNYGKLGLKLAEFQAKYRQEVGKNSVKTVNSTSEAKVEQKTIDKSSNLCYNRSIILVQNTLGYTWDASKLENLARKYNAYLIEDLAHSAGRRYPDGREVGTIGEAVALSFGKGKAIDTVSGGAVIFRDSQKPTQPLLKPKLSDRLRDRWYPLFGLISRIWWPLGRLYMGVLVKLHFVQRSADAELNLNRRLTHWQARLVNQQLYKLPRTPLRKFKIIENRDLLLDELHKNGYNFEEIWYNTPVSPERYADEADFPVHKCPRTVEISQHIVNIPTWYSDAKMQKAYQIIRKYEAGV